MNIYQAFLAIASCFLVFSGNTSAFKLFNCELPYNITLQVSQDKVINFYQPELNVYYESRMRVSSLPGSNVIDFHTDKVRIEFNSFMFTKNVEKYFFILERSSEQPAVFSETYSNFLQGFAQRGSSSNDGCRIILTSADSSRPEATSRIANELHRLAESCLELQLCGQITKGTIRVTPQLDVNNTALTTSSPDSQDDLPQDCATSEGNDVGGKIFNVLVDAGLSQAVVMLDASDDGSVGLPDIIQEFSTGSGIFLTTGHFKAQNGLLSDLRMVRRTSNVSLTRDNMKLMISCTFGLDALDIFYKEYSAKYGILHAGGTLKAKVDKLSVLVRVAADYNSNPCQVKIDTLEIVKMGDLDINLTGLGPLTWLLSKITNWVLSMMRTSISSLVEAQGKNALEEILSTIECERYRPFEFTLPLEFVL